MPNSFAGYLNLTLPLALALATWALMHARATRRVAHPEGQPPARFRVEANRLLAARPVLLALTLLLAAGMIATGVITSFSRGAWLGLAFGVVVMIAALGRRGRPAIVGLGALVALLLLLASAGALPSAVVGRLGSIVQQFQVFDVRGVVPTADTFAQIERLAHWQTAGNMFLANPVLGVGIGNFNARFADYYVRGWPHSQGHAHNYYLQTLAETGLVGFATYVLLLLTALGSSLAALRRTRGLYQALVVGALGVLATFMLHNVLENLHVLNLGLHWAAVLALFTILPRAQAAEDAAAPATPGRPAALRGAA